MTTSERAPGEGDLADLLQQPRFGRQLRAFRLERGLSQAEVADAQISTAYLSRLESGARQPTVKVFEYLLERLGLTAAAFRPAGRDQLSTLLATVASSDTGTVDAAELARSLQQARSADPATRWQALWLLSRAQDQAAQREDELVTLRELVALSEGLDAPELRVRSLNQLARCLRATGDLVSAQEAAAASFAAAQQLPVAEQARPLMTLVSTEAEMGRTPTPLPTPPNWRNSSPARGARWRSRHCGPRRRCASGRAGPPRRCG
ncbi:helix-turn-helix domain-containing protein [Catellatospora bangladeshensis]|uniref:helix-turn-helix domain-containing protein n=1 Tax=Catellatospora bangladeshensis TaxID=310355 RepID=UPI00360A8C80